MLSHDEEVRTYLDRLAKMMGRVFSTDLGVIEDGDKLIFIDADDEPIMNDGQEIIAATSEEVANKEIGEFMVRALRAAGIAKFQEIERSRSP